MNERVSERMMPMFTTSNSSGYLGQNEISYKSETVIAAEGDKQRRQQQKSQQRMKLGHPFVLTQLKITVPRNRHHRNKGIEFFLFRVKSKSV